MDSCEPCQSFHASLIYFFVSVSALLCYIALKKRETILLSLGVLAKLHTYTRKDLKVKGNYCTIEFYMFGTKHQVILPYRRDLRINRRSSIMVGIKDKEQTKLDHYNGIPLMVSPQEMGYDSIYLSSRRETKSKEGGEVFDNPKVF